MMKHASNASQSRCIYAIFSSFLSRCFKCNGYASSKKKHHSKSSLSPWRLCPISGRSLKRMMPRIKNMIYARGMPQLQEDEQRQLSIRRDFTEILFIYEKISLLDDKEEKKNSFSQKNPSDKTSKDL